MEEMGKNNKVEGEMKKGVLIWSARGGNKHVWPLPGRQPIHQADVGVGKSSDLKSGSSGKLAVESMN